MGLLVLAMSPVEAAAIMVIPALLTNIWQAVAGPELSSLLKRFWPTLLATGAATLVLAGVMSAHADIAITILGALLVVYGAYSLRGSVVHLSRKTEIWLGPLSGAVTGIVTALTGVSSMPSVPFLQSLGLRRDAFIQSMGLSFSVSAFALIGALGLSGDFEGVSPVSIVAATLGAFAGMAAGTRLRRAMDETMFRKVILWGLIVLGAYLVLR